MCVCVCVCVCVSDLGAVRIMTARITGCVPANCGFLPLGYSRVNSPNLGELETSVPIDAHPPFFKFLSAFLTFSVKTIIYIVHVNFQFSVCGINEIK